MHLVDAIRMAAQKSVAAQPPGEPAAPPAPAAPANDISEAPIPMEQKKTNPTPEKAVPNVPISGATQVNEPVGVNPAVPAAGGSVVRLELFLTPEQMNQMLRGILNGAHTVMTLREAAQYLRMSQESLVQLAEAGEIAGFIVENKWRFPRHSVDEWMTLQTLQKRDGNEENEDAA